MSDNYYLEDEDFQQAIAQGVDRENWIHAVANAIPNINDLLDDKDFAEDQVIVRRALRLRHVAEMASEEDGHQISGRQR